MNIFPLFFGLFFTFTSDRPLKTNDCFYDWEQRLTEVKEYASSSLQWTATYTYDPLGNLVKKVKGGTTTTYVQDLNGGLPQILIEDDGATVAKYTYGGDRLKVSRSGDYYYFYDALGSTRTITNTSGTVICRYVYDVYGKPLDSECNEAQTWNNFKFTGELYDEDTELVYLRARWYDPTTGRFVSRDKVAGHDYGYCGNDPVNATDPTGHIPINALGAVYAIGMAMKVMGIVFNIKSHFDACIANWKMLGEWFFERTPGQDRFVVDSTGNNPLDARIRELMDSDAVNQMREDALSRYYFTGDTEYTHHPGTIGQYFNNFDEGYKSTVFWMGGFGMTITIDESNQTMVFHITDQKDWNSGSLPPLWIHPVELIPGAAGLAGTAIDYIVGKYSEINPNYGPVERALRTEWKNSTSTWLKGTWICKNFWQRERGQTGGVLGMLVNHGGTMYMEYIWDEPLPPGGRSSGGGVGGGGGSGW